MAVYALWILVFGSLGAFSLFLTPNQRLLIGTFGLLLLIKVTILLRWPSPGLRDFSKCGLALYLTVWPGIDPTPFRWRSTARLEPKGRMIGGGLCFLAGLVAGAAAVAAFPGSPRTAEWLALASLLLMVHFGFSEFLTLALRWLGWNVGPLFEVPLASRSLRDFWGRRWNLAFVEMDKILFLPWLKKHMPMPAAVFGVFLISGLLHEAAISYPAGRGWGLPTLYFILHGALALVEARAMNFKSWSVAAARAWTWVGIVAPLPLLFHAPFREMFLGGLLEWITGMR